MRKILYYFINLLVNNVISDDVFSNHCNVPNGFIWCDTSNKCLRPIDEPCLPITKDCAICLINNYIITIIIMNMIVKKDVLWIL